MQQVTRTTYNIYELRFSTANVAELFTADVIFSYIFTKNNVDLTHRAVIFNRGSTEPKGSAARLSSVKKIIIT